jgi:hypothetical protein
MYDPDSVNMMRNALLEMSDNMAALLDAIDGYRKQLEERGYSPTASEQMAIEYHRHLLAAVFQRREEVT